MASSKEVDLHSIITVVQSIEGIVAKFYGPSCSQTLLTSSTGKAVVTADGYTILQALQFSHPIACLVKNAIEKCHAQTQDGCKTFIIYLASMLRAVQSHLEKFHMNCGNNGNNLLERQALITVSVGLNKFSCELATIYQRLVEHSLKLFKHLNVNNSHLEILKCVSVTSLLPQFSPRLSNFISDILIELIVVKDEYEIIRTLKFIIDNFDIIVIKAANQPYSNCRKIEPYILQREFSVKCDNIKEPLKAILMCCPVDNSRNDSETLESFSVKSGAQFSNSLYHRIKVVTAFAQMCKKEGVNLVLSTEVVTSYALDVFRKYEISVVSCVATEDIQIIEYLTSKTAVCDIFDEIGEINIIPVNHCDDVLVGTQKCVQINIDGIVKFNHMIVCAPTVGLCDQLCWLSQKALKSMLNCFSEIHCDQRSPRSACASAQSDQGLHWSPGDTSNESLVHQLVNDINKDVVTCPKEIPHDGTEAGNEFNLIANDFKCDMETLGKKESCTSSMLNETTLLLIESGGCFEILLSNYLENHVKICKDANTSILCHILIETLMTVPQTLYFNTTEGTPRSRSYLKVKQTLVEKAQESDGVWGVDMYGEPCDMRETGCVEPLLSKIHVLECVLRLVVQLLRIDGVLSGKKDTKMN